MSGLETLPPDQRAVLQLILAQGRGYADLAATLRLDAAAVRERALAAAQALATGGAAGLDDDARGRIVDYLLGQQDAGERIVTFAELGSSPAACRWAQELRERFAGVAHAELPEVPAAATLAVASGGAANGTAPVATAAPAAPAPAPAPAPAVQAAPVPVSPPVAQATPPAPPSPPPTAGGSGSGAPKPSRLGGAILIAGAAALAIVLAIVLIGGGSDSKGTATTSAQTQQQTTAATQTTPRSAARATTIGVATLRPPAGGGSLGGALVQQAGSRRLIAVEAVRLAPNTAQDTYAIWLQGTAGTRFLGFVPTPVGRDGTFTVSSQLSSSLNLAAFANVLVTREGVTAKPSTPGTIVLRGPLRLAG